MTVYRPNNPQLRKLYRNDVVALAQEKVATSAAADPGGYICEAMYRLSMEPGKSGNGSITGVMFERATLSAMAACGIDMMRVQHKWQPDDVKDAVITLRIVAAPVFYVVLATSYRERWRRTDRDLLVCKAYNKTPARYVSIFYCENPEKDRSLETALRLAENLTPKFLLEEIELYTALDSTAIKQLFREIRDAQLQRGDRQQLRSDRGSSEDLFQGR